MQSKLKGDFLVLALSRKKGESIIIGSDVEIIVLGISGDQVKLGIVAPKDITVHRKEIYEQIIDANKEAQYNKSLEKIKELLNR